MDLSAWFRELRRRRVIRALLGWGLLSFAVLQVIEPLQHALGLGEWFLKAVVAVLAVGFPATAGLSWAFDLTRSGVERTAPAAEEPGPRGRARAAPAVAIALVGAAIGAAVVGLAGYHLWGRTPSPGPDGRISVAVADFVNDTKDGDLDGLSAQLITSLEQSQRLRVLTRSRVVDVLRQLGKPSVPVVDELLGGEMARAAGARALVVASIRRFDDLYSIDLKVLDPSTSEYFFTLKEERAGKASIPGMIDRLSEKARERLKETPAQVMAARVAVGDATTRNFEALQHYFAGLRNEEALDQRKAIAEYRKAAAIDPRFALAQYRIAFLGTRLVTDVAERRNALDAAFRELDRMPAKERLLLQAWKAHVEHRDEEAHAIYARAADAYPQDKDVQFLAAELFLHERRYAEALPWLERVLALDPLWPDALGPFLTNVLPALGRREEALDRARRWAEKAPGIRSRIALVYSLVVTGRLDEAVAVARLGAAGDRLPISQRLLAGALMMADRFAEAEEIVRPLTAEGAEGRLGALPQLLSALAHQGRIREAVKLVEADPRQLDTPFWFGSGLLWNVLYSSSDPALALHAAAAYDEGAIHRDSPGTDLLLWRVKVGDERGAARTLERETDPSRRRLHGAVVTWKHGDPVAALEQIRALEADARGKLEFVWWHAFIAFDAGQYAESIAMTEEFERSMHLNPWRAGGIAELLHRKALAHERLGDRDAARATAGRLLDRWTRADPDLPLLAETRALCRKLGCQDPATVARK
jgi:tetratricopeptide (TPR) repeat protein